MSVAPWSGYNRQYCILLEHRVINIHSSRLSIAQCFICIYILNACAAGVILVLNLFMDVQSLECLDRQADARVAATDEDILTFGLYKAEYKCKP